MEINRQIAALFLFSIFWLVMGLYCSGCVKTVYLPEDAAFYKSEMEYFKKQADKCEFRLDMCLELGEDLRREVAID